MGITDGDSLFDIRGNFGDEGLDGQSRSGANDFIKLDPLASKCPSYLEVCCRHPDYDEYDITVRPSTQRPVTKCIDGTDRDYYGFGFGDRWAKHEYCEYKEKIDDYEKDVEEEKRKISNAGSSAERKAIRKNIRGYNKDIKKMKKLLPLYENAILNCARGKQDFDCNVYDYGRDDEEDGGDFDLSGHARDSEALKEGSGEAIPKANPRIKIPE